MKRSALVVLLCLALISSGCSAAWVNTLDGILSAAAPALINILNIIAIAQGQPVNVALVAKINADTATVKTLSADFAAASTAAAPTACAQLQAGLATYSADQTQVMALVNISNPATQAKTMTLSALIAGTVVAALAVIPDCKQAAEMRASLATRAVPLPLKAFVKSYNANLVVPTGMVAVDGFTRSHKLHTHGPLLRAISFGLAQ